MNIEPLHLPPEESRAFGSAGADPSPAATSHNHSMHHHAPGGSGVNASSSSSSSSHSDPTSSTSSMRLQYESSEDTMTRLQTQTMLLSTQPTMERAVSQASSMTMPNKYQEMAHDEGDTGTIARGIFARAKATSGGPFFHVHIVYLTFISCTIFRPLFEQIPLSTTYLLTNSLTTCCSHRCFSSKRL